MVPIVVDTNVLVSAFVADRTPLAVLETARHGRTRLFATVDMLVELQLTLNRPRFARYAQQRGVQVEHFVSDYMLIARLVTPASVTDCPVADPKDLMFVECAIAAGADYIVTGDHHLLDVGSYRQIRMVQPAEFLTYLSKLS